MAPPLLPSLLLLGLKIGWSLELGLDFVRVCFA
jgi:hypothetical protein